MFETSHVCFNQTFLRLFVLVVNQMEGTLHASGRTTLIVLDTDDGVLYTVPVCRGIRGTSRPAMIDAS